MPTGQQISLSFASFWSFPPFFPGELWADYVGVLCHWLWLSSWFGYCWLVLAHVRQGLALIYWKIACQKGGESTEPDSDGRTRSGHRVQRHPPRRPDAPRHPSRTKMLLWHSGVLIYFNNSRTVWTTKTASTFGTIVSPHDVRAVTMELSPPLPQRRSDNPFNSQTACPSEQWLSRVPRTHHNTAQCTTNIRPTRNAHQHHFGQQLCQLLQVLLH